MTSKNNIFVAFVNCKVYISVNVLILFTTVISYFAAILLERFNDNKTLKKFILIMTLLSCLGVLFMFKYFNFFSRSFIKLMSLFAIELHPVTLRFLSGLADYSLRGIINRDLRQFHLRRSGRLSQQH